MVHPLRLYLVSSNHLITTRNPSPIILPLPAEVENRGRQDFLLQFMWCSRDKWVSSRNTTLQFSSLSILWKPPFNLVAPSVQHLTLWYVSIHKKVQILWEASGEREQPSESQATACLGWIPKAEIEAGFWFPGCRWSLGTRCFHTQTALSLAGECFFVLHEILFLVKCY